MRSAGFFIAAHIVAFFFASEAALLAQDPFGVPVAAAADAPPSGAPGAPVMPGQPGPPGEQPDNAAEKKPKSEEPPSPRVIRREEATEGKADPDELKATVGEDGRVAFEFRNQPWIDLVQWLAEISELPLDWQELPADRVNMTSPGRYTVVETRDLFNRHLLARGYTLLQLDGGLIVAKAENINPAIVPRVEPEQLALLEPYTFVQTSLDVGWLSAEKLAVELKPMISSNGRLTALTTTNRLEAMDAAVNLRQIENLLRQEKSIDSREALAPEFKLRYLGAEEAKSMLEEFLGVKKEKEAPMSPQQMQMMQQMRQQQGQPPIAESKQPEVSIVANSRQNSVLIRATPDRVAVATEFLKRIDVPGESMVSLADVQSRVQAYRLASLDPEKFVEIISDMNVLEPSTRVRVDKANQALIVSGSGADRFIIEQLIERLDGSGRRFEVLQLRRLDAAEVAESIGFLMGQKQDEQPQSRRSYFYSFFDRNEEDSKKKDEFRVAANTRYRQVLLWANEIEMDEVRSLLRKLGELPPEGGSRQPFRVIDAAATPETYEYLQQLRRQWERLSPNPLQLPDAELFVDPNDKAKATSEEGRESPATESNDGKKPDSGRAIEIQQDKEPSQDDLAFHSERIAGGGISSGEDDSSVTEASQATNATARTLMVLTRAQNQAAQEDDGVPMIRSAEEFDQLFGTPPQDRRGAEQAVAPDVSAKSSQAGSPVEITVDRNGNLVLSSEDTDALDRLESLMLQVTPPQRPYRVFPVRYASASWMVLNLEDYFKDRDENESSDADRFFGWYFGTGDSQEKKKPAGLGAGAKMRFISDNDTNTIVVSGATQEQLRTIGELIELWDVPEPVNRRKTRFTQLVPVLYGKADKIANTVKDAYRDLLSSNDRAFQAGGQRGGPGGQRGGDNRDTPRSRDGNGSGLVDANNGQDGGGTDFSFKGKLAIGVDEVGNTLLVSAEGEPLLQLVCDMIGQLDDAARPRGEVQVLQYSGTLSGDTLERALRSFREAAQESPRRSSPPSPNVTNPDSD